MQCPDCGSDMVLRETWKLSTRDGKPKKFYGCTRYPACRGTHGAHPDGTPLGVPADAETRAARIRLHALCEKKFQSTAEMYDWLATEAPRAHIGEMNISEIEETESLLENYLSE